MYRMFEPEIDFTSPSRHVTRTSGKGGWSVDDEGEVRRLPPLPNWPMLAFCQSVLAIPLIFLWLALLWRRKRRDRRLAGATA